VIGFSGNVIAADLPPSATRVSGQPILNSDIAEPFVYENVLPDESLLPIVVEDDDPKAPRMKLSGFDIHGVVERPELGITKKIIEHIAEEEAFRIAPAEKPLGFTISMFEQVANTISRYYRQKGFFLARAYIPEQTVRDGIVRLEIIESFLDQVVFDGNKVYSDEQLREPLKQLLNKPIFKDDIEQALFTLDDYPGVQISSIFGPGSKPGSAAMLVKVKDEKSSAFVSFDNYGSIFTGENRLRLHQDFNNLFGQADRFSYNLLVTMSPQNGLYGDIAYSQPMFSPKYRVGGGLSINQFDVGQELADLGITGESTILNGFISRQFLRSRRDNFAMAADLSLKNATSKVVDTVAAEDKLSVIRLDAIYAGIDRWLSPAQHSASLSLSIGLADFLGSMDSNGNGLSGRRGGSQQRAGGDFTKLFVSYTRSQPIFELQTLLFRFRAQFTSDLLTAIEQFSLGGPDTVRAYPVAEALVDEAMFTSIEWIAYASPEITQTWLNKLQFSVFYDYATGSKNDPLVNEVPEVTLAGLGFSVQASPFNVINARIDFAFAAGGDKPSENQTLPFYFRLEYPF
jgi:hemolysin activation/secretion protein